MDSDVSGIEDDIHISDISTTDASTLLTPLWRVERFLFPDGQGLPSKSIFLIVTPNLSIECFIVSWSNPLNVRDIPFSSLASRTLSLNQAQTFPSCSPPWTLLSVPRFRLTCSSSHPVVPKEPKRRKMAEAVQRGKARGRGRSHLKPNLLEKSRYKHDM